MGACVKRQARAIRHHDVRGAFVTVCFALFGAAVVSAPSNGFASAVVVPRSQAQPVLSEENAVVVYREESAVQLLFMQARFEYVKQGFAWWIPVPAALSPNGEGSAPAWIATADLSLVLTRLVRSFCDRARQFVIKDRQFSPNQTLQHPCEAVGHLVSDSPDSARLPSSRQGTPVSARVSLRWAALQTTQHLHELLLENSRLQDFALHEYLVRYVGDGASVVIVDVLPDFGVLPNDTQQTSWTSPVIAVRFSAKTPWYPYREPSYPILHAGADLQRVIRVTVLSEYQRELKIGPSRPTSVYTWLAFEPHFTEVSDAFAAAGAELAMAALVDHEQRWWAASFEDEGFVRAGDDDWSFENAGKIPDNSYAIDKPKAPPKVNQPVTNHVSKTADAEKIAPSLAYGKRPKYMKWRRTRLRGSSRDLRIVAPVTVLFSALTVAFAQRMLGNAAARKKQT